MKYACLRCGRTLELSEEASFCPFCGSAYRTAAQAQPTAAMKIVMGSDSERTIQEKYWKRTRDAVNDAVNRLLASMPRFSWERKRKETWDKKACKLYETEILVLSELSKMEYCTSIAEFRAKMKDILGKVEKEYQVNSALVELGKKYIEEDQKISAERKTAMECGEWSVEELEDEYSIDVDAEETFIQQFCMDLAENLGNVEPDRLQPELDYDPDETDWMNDEENDGTLTKCFALFPDYASLWREIQEAIPALTAALESNGLFVLTMIHGDAWEDFDPKQCVKDLQQLKNGDYDPLFGESPERFIRTYFDGLANLMSFINELPDYMDIMELSPEQKLLNLKNEMDEIKLDSLKRLIRRWSEILMMELDRLYQSQSENMMDVCGGIEKMRKSLDEKE